MRTAIKKLFSSRKFIVALSDAVAVLLILYFKVGEEQAPIFAGLVTAIAAALIAGIAYEDAAEKANK